MVKIEEKGKVTFGQAFKDYFRDMLILKVGPHVLVIGG